jgi:hypothetical protein
MFTRIDKAIMAGLGAAASVATTAITQHGHADVTTAELAIGSFIVVGVLTFLWPNKQAASGAPG